MAQRKNKSTILGAEVEIDLENKRVQEVWCQELLEKFFAERGIRVQADMFRTQSQRQQYRKYKQQNALFHIRFEDAQQFFLFKLAFKEDFINDLKLFFTDVAKSIEPISIRIIESE